MLNVEFTDRYGGRAPSWLRGCFDQCEAMGVIPVFMRVDGTKDARPPDETRPELITAWQNAHAQDGDRLEDICDGWHFVQCPSCKGTWRR